MTAKHEPETMARSVAKGAREAIVIELLLWPVVLVLTATSTPGFFRAFLSPLYWRNHLISLSVAFPFVWAWRVWKHRQSGRPSA